MMLKKSGFIAGSIDLFLNQRIISSMGLKSYFSSSTHNSAFNNFPVSFYSDLSREERLATLSKSIKEIASSPELIVDRFRKERGGVRTAIQIREDLGSFHPIPEDRLVLENLNRRIRDTFLNSVFAVDNLELERITFEHSSGNVLEKVARGESVHRVRSLSELKRRLHGISHILFIPIHFTFPKLDGRRCFALFHPCMPEEPIVFVHIGLCTSLATSLSSLETFKSDDKPSHAMFYSINSPIAGLSGLELASHLIKEASKKIASEFPTINTFSTLSPIPNFMKWLGQLSEGKYTAANLRILDGFKVEMQRIYRDSGYCTEDQEILSLVNNILLKRTSLTAESLSDMSPSQMESVQKLSLSLCAFYLAKEKTPGGRGKPLPLDPVARFHLRNGASLHSINWMANPSLQGLNSSGGMMVNYLYDMPLLESRAKMFAASAENFHISTSVDTLLQF